jgi:hypothetical protein
MEDRLRRAIAARTRSVEPSDDGLERITEKLLDTGGPEMKLPSGQTRWYLVAAAAIVLAGIAGGIALAGGGGDDATTVPGNPTTTDKTDRTTTTPSGPTTTEAGSGTSVTTKPTGDSNGNNGGGTPTTAGGGSTGAPADVVRQAIWPRPSSTTRFTDPVKVTRSYARYYAGFHEPVVGAFRQGDSRSGEVPVTPTATNRTETTVLVRKLSDDHWYVIGATTADITVTTPQPGAKLSCPQQLSGTALAYEGVVQVRIDAYQPDGKRVFVGRGTVMGGGGPAAPFSSRLSCRVPSGVEQYGIITFYTVDESGEYTPAPTWSATSFPVRLR